MTPRTRRAFLRTGAAAGGLALSGCLSALGFESRSAYAPPTVANPPAAVYYPSHVEGMKMSGATDAGPYRCALTYSYPHRFWIVTGTDRKKVEIGSDDSVHLMAILWEPETGIVPPVGSVTMELVRDGETAVEKPPWPMLSQNMGFHFGDNVALPGEGTYDVTVRVDPLSTRTTGAFEGAFGDPATASFTFEYSREDVNEISFRTLDEKQGTRGALSPMEMDMMVLSRLPAPGELPGRAVGRATSGDGLFLVRALPEPPAGIDAEGTYLAVSARTPYNRYPLPFMGLSATLERGGEVVFDDALLPALDPGLDYHYGAAVDGVRSGDTLTLSVGAPPQVARHEGYETAFFEMDPMEVTVG